MPYGTLNADTITNSNGLSGNAIGPGFKNRIINGDMRIDQRNAGAAVTVNTSGNFYAVDRFFSTGQVTDGVFTVQQSTTAPTGFTNSIISTVTTADASIGATQQYLVGQYIEGFNVADLGWGTASAKTVTLSFWVRSSLTGTFGGSLQNSAFNRSYPFSYTISAANTWEQKSVTVAGDTSGTWVTNNGAGLRLFFSLGGGSSYLGTAGAWSGSFLIGTTGQTQVISTLNATWYITGVQLEVAPSATSFDYRPYGTELSLCQRYYYKIYPNVSGDVLSNGFAFSTTGFAGIGQFPVPLRASPSALEQTGTATDYAWNGSTNVACSAVPTFVTRTNEWMHQTNFTVASGLTSGHGGSAVTNSTAGYLAWSAEL